MWIFQLEKLHCKKYVETMWISQPVKLHKKVRVNDGDFSTNEITPKKKVERREFLDHRNYIKKSTWKWRGKSLKFGLQCIDVISTWNQCWFHVVCLLGGNLFITKHWEFHGLSSTLNLQGSEEYGKPLCFPIFSLYYVNSLFPCSGNYMDFCFTQNIKETHKFGMFVFPMLFLCYGNPLFLRFGNCMDFYFIRKI